MRRHPAIHPADRTRRAGSSACFRTLPSAARASGTGCATGADRQRSRGVAAYRATMGPPLSRVRSGRPDPVPAAPIVAHAGVSTMSCASSPKASRYRGRPCAATTACAAQPRRSRCRRTRYCHWRVTARRNWSVMMVRRFPGRSSSRSREADWDIQGLAHPYQLRINQPSGRVFVVWKLDRLSRSLKDVLHIMDRIADAGAGFRSVTENIDTTTPAGRIYADVGSSPSSSAHDPRAHLRRHRAGRAEGRVGGRRKKLEWQAPRNRESVITGRKSGADMARLYNVSQPTVSRIVAQHRMAQP